MWYTKDDELHPVEQLNKEPKIPHHEKFINIITEIEEVLAAQTKVIVFSSLLVALFSSI